MIIVYIYYWNNSYIIEYIYIYKVYINNNNPINIQ